MKSVMLQPISLEILCLEQVIYLHYLVKRFSVTSKNNLAEHLSEEQHGFENKSYFMQIFHS